MKENRVPTMKYLTRHAFASILLIAGLFLTGAGYAEVPPPISNQQHPSLSNMLQMVMPAVVNISAQGEIAIPSNPLAERMPGQQNSNGPNGNRDAKGRFESIGSGVIIDAKEGYIITNAHLLKDVKSVTVTLSDGRRLDAKIIGIDAPSDIAILQIKANHLQAIQISNSNTVKVGDFVAAIGNPFGLKQTVTSGIVSAKGRSDLGIEGYENFIQTDASINPGNSGGALVNLKGQLVGINTAIIAPDGGNIGIGFAIPVNMALDVGKQLIKYGKIHRGIMGVLVQNLSPELSRALNVGSAKGAVVTEVRPGSPAQKAGLQVGDIIQSVNGKSVTTAFQVRNIVGLVRIGSQVSLHVLRQGKQLQLSAVVVDPKAYKEVEKKRNPFLYGAIYNDFSVHTTALGNISGVQLLQVKENSPLWRAGLRPGDVIMSANGDKITHFTQLETVAKQAKSELLVRVLRVNGAFYKVINRG